MIVESVDMQSSRYSVDLQSSRWDLKPQVGHFGLLYFSAKSKMLDKVDLEASRCDLKPHIGQFGYSKPFVSANINFLLFYWG